ncbi:SLC13 family permease [Candidatus Margulisiibacteriota bacterium]
MFTATIIFIGVYIIVVSEKIPNAITVILGASLMIFFNILNQEIAIQFIDFNTIGLLCGMMLIVSVLRKTGIFEYISIKAIKSVKGNPWHVLVVLSLFTAVMSALLDNVTTVLIIVPITLAIADALKVTPMPFLISQIFFANIGGTATLIGDPPNILIGNSANIRFIEFIYHNVPIVIIASIFCLICLKFMYGKKLVPQVDVKDILSHFDETRAITDKKILYKSLFVFSLVLVGFLGHDILHFELATIALAGAFLLMLITNTNIEEIFKEVEWSTLFFFIGLFILVGGLEISGIINLIAVKLLNLTETTSAMTITILWISALASTLIDNVPFTATMISVIKSIGAMSRNIDIYPLWWALSLGACFGGNGTIIGSAANIVIVSYANKNNYPIRFLDFALVGFPIMIGTIILSTGYLYLVHLR